MIEYAWYDFVGNVGVLLVVLAYFGIQSGKLAFDDIRYPVLNAAGAVMILVSLFYNFNLSSFIIECVWLAISIYGLARILMRES